MAAHGSLPPPWAAIVLTLATFRLLRLIGWDTFPPIAELRGWILGEDWSETDKHAEREGFQKWELRSKVRSDGHPKGERWMLADLVGCPFCLGLYLSVAVYVLWLWQPTVVMYGSAPFALSAAIGLIAKNLDP